MNVFEYSLTTEKNWKINLGNMSDYEPKYTFYSDFAIAEFCEVYMRDRDAVKKTFRRIIKSWGKDIKAITEVALVLNHKCWAFDGRVDSKYLGVNDNVADYFGKLYLDLYYEVDKFICNKFKNDSEAMSYYYRVTD